MYVAFLHPTQVYSLRTTTSTTTVQWFDIQKAAMMGGEIEKNPIFNGALGIYNNVILHESSYVPNGISGATGLEVTSVKRAIFAGAQALNLAFGQDFSFDNFDWNEKLFDYGNSLGVEAGCMFGVKKSVFNAGDLSTIVIPTYGA